MAGLIISIILFLIISLSNHNWIIKKKLLTILNMFNTLQSIHQINCHYKLNSDLKTVYDWGYLIKSYRAKTKCMFSILMFFVFWEYLGQKGCKPIQIIYFLNQLFKLYKTRPKLAYLLLIHFLAIFTHFGQKFWKNWIKSKYSNFGLVL